MSACHRISFLAIIISALYYFLQENLEIAIEERHISRKKSRFLAQDQGDRPLCGSQDHRIYHTRLESSPDTLGKLTASPLQTPSWI